MTDSSTAGVLRRATLKGVATMFPVFLTLAALLFAWSILSGFLKPLAEGVLLVFTGSSVPVWAVQLVVALALAAITIGVGLVAETRSSESWVAARAEDAISALPVVGTVYETADRIGEMFFENDTGSFEDVVLVELPDEGLHTLGFVTSAPPESVQDATDADLTVFVPLAPNPAMAGFLANVSRDQVTDVDMSVEAGVQAIMTTGVGVGNEFDGDPLAEAGDGDATDSGPNEGGASDGDANDGGATDGDASDGDANEDEGLDESSPIAALDGEPVYADDRDGDRDAWSSGS